MNKFKEFNIGDKIELLVGVFLFLSYIGIFVYISYLIIISGINIPLKIFSVILAWVGAYVFINKPF
jgi:hypothetical protein